MTTTQNYGRASEMARKRKRMSALGVPGEGCSAKTKEGREFLKRSRAQRQGRIMGIAAQESENR